MEVAMSEHLRSPETATASARFADASRAHILIVDDHAPSRRICASYCDLFDHTSVMAAGGGEALRALKRERFHAVVMSVHMAENGPVDLLRAIRGLPAPASETPIIGVTAVGRGDETQRWLGAGLAGVLAKPLTAARLYAALNMVTTAGREEARTRSWAPAG
jgi:two-component system, sensor histidine kinase